MAAAAPTPDQLIAAVVGMYATKWIVEKKSPPVLTNALLDEALQNLAAKKQISAELLVQSKALLAQPSARALVSSCSAVAAYVLRGHIQAKAAKATGAAPKATPVIPKPPTAGPAPVAPKPPIVEPVHKPIETPVIRPPAGGAKGHNLV
jgi:hypothetical protein